MNIIKKITLLSLAFITNTLILSAHFYIFDELLNNIYAGNIEGVKQCLRDGADPNRLVSAIYTGNIEIVKLLIEGGAEVNAGILHRAIIQGKIEVVELLLEKGAELNDKAIWRAIYQKDIEIVKLLLEKVPDPKEKQGINFSEFLVYAMDKSESDLAELILDNVDLGRMDLDEIKDLLTVALETKNLDIVKLLIEQRGDIGEEAMSKALFRASMEDYQEIVDMLLNRGADPKELDRARLVKMLKNMDTQEVLEKFKTKEIDYSKPEVMKEIFLSGSYLFVRYLFDNVPELENAYLIGVGMNEHRGETTEALLSVVSERIKKIKNAYHVDLSLEMVQDEDIMKRFSGLINPGGRDSYPAHSWPFGLKEMREEKMIYSEKVYQRIVESAKKYDIPYLGVCAGAQTLILKSDGYLKKGGYDVDTEVELFPGTLPHFLFLDETEREKMLSECQSEKIELKDAYANHEYAGYIGNMGKGMKLGGVSKDNIPMAYAVGGNKIGVQFHPELTIEEGNSVDIERYQNFFDNVFGIFEGYYRSMQYAKKMGIDEPQAKAAMRKVNEELIGRLEGCLEKGKDSEKILATKKQKRSYQGAVKTITFLPGITPEDIAITREGDKNLKIYFKDGESGELVLLDRYDSSYLMYGTCLEFADGSIIELEPSQIPLDQSFGGEDLNDAMASVRNQDTQFGVEDLNDAMPSVRNQDTQSFREWMIKIVSNAIWGS